MNFDEFEKLSKEEKTSIETSINVLIDMMAESGDVYMIFLQKRRQLEDTVSFITLKFNKIINQKADVFEKASNLFEQFNTLLKDFIKENNWEDEEDDKC